MGPWRSAGGWVLIHPPYFPPSASALAALYWLSPSTSHHVRLCFVLSLDGILIHTSSIMLEHQATPYEQDQPASASMGLEEMHIALHFQLHCLFTCFLFFIRHFALFSEVQAHLPLRVCETVQYCVINPRLRCLSFQPFSLSLLWLLNLYYHIFKSPGFFLLCNLNVGYLTLSSRPLIFFFYLVSLLFPQSNHFFNTDTIFFLVMQVFICFGGLFTSMSVRCLT